MSETPMAWLRRREAPPELLRKRLEGALLRSDGDGPVPEALAGAGARALSRAMAGPGRARETGLALLDADAFVTYACEAAADGADADVASSLDAVLRRVLAAAP